MKINVARRAELSRYKFVCRWRYPGGTGEDQCGAQGRAFEVQVCLSVAMSGGTGEEQCGAQGRAFEVQVCLSVVMSGGTGEEQCGAQGCRAFEVQVCLSLAVFARFLCERRAKVAGNFVTFIIKLRQNDETKRRKSREREYRRTFPEAGKMAKQGRCPTKPASRGKSASQLNANEQLSNGATKVPREEKSA